MGTTKIILKGNGEWLIIKKDSKGKASEKPAKAVTPKQENERANEREKLIKLAHSLKELLSVRTSLNGTPEPILANEGDNAFDDDEIAGIINVVAQDLLNLAKGK